MTGRPTPRRGQARWGGLLWDRNFRWFWFGETTSKIGSAMTTVAIPLVAVLVLDAGTFLVGLLQALAWLPWLVFGLPAGAWIDRLPKKPVMLLCDVVAFVLFASVPVAAWLGLLTTAQLMLVVLLAGVASVLFSTAYQPFLLLLFSTGDLPEANAKLQGSEAAAKLLGPGLGGTVAQLFGAVTGLLGDALTFAVSALCLLQVRSREPRRALGRTGRSLRREIGEGLRFIIRDPYLRVMTAHAAASSYSDAIFDAVVVVFLLRSVGLSPDLVGLLIAAWGLGGVAGAAASSTITRWFGTARGMLLCEACMVPFSLLMPLTTPGPGLMFYVIAAVVPAAGIVAFNIITTSFRQTYVPTHLLGRTMATTRLVSYGVLPLGSLTAALLSQVIGPREVIIVASVAKTLSVSVLFIGPLRRHRDFPRSVAVDA